MEGKNCFRERWSQGPLFSGGPLASIALPLPHSASTVEKDPSGLNPASRGQNATTAKAEECLLMACGDAVNVVRASTGEVLCRYTLPMEDVILHIDAVSVLSPPPSVTAVKQSKTTKLKEEDSKAAAEKLKGKRPIKGKAAQGKEEELITVDPEREVPVGSYIAVGTRALQIYVLRVEMIMEQASGATTAPSSSDAEQDEPKESDVGAVATVDVSYRVDLVQNWTAAQQAISLVRFTADGVYLISGSTDGAVKVWNVFHHHLTHSFYCQHGSLIHSAYVDPAENFLIVGSFEGHVNIFDFAAKRLVASGRPHVHAVEAICLNDELDKIFTIGRDRRLSIGEWGSRAKAGALARNGGRHNGVHSSNSPAPAAGEIVELRGIVVKDHVSAAVFETSELLHIGAMDGVVSTYRVSATEPVQLVRRLPKPPAADAEDSAEEAFVRSLLVAQKPKGAEADRLHGFWVDDKTSSASSSLYVGDAGFNVLQLVPDVAGVAGKYSVASTLVGFLDQILDISLFPAASPLHRVVVTNSKDVRLYAGAGCSAVQTLQGHRDVVMACAVSSDGQYVATGGKDKEVRIWSATTFQTVLVGLDGHTEEITALRFNAKQSATYFLLFSVSSDENMRVWDVGAQLAAASPCSGGVTMTHRSGVSSAHGGPIYTIAVSANDQYVATGGKDKVVNLWNITGKKIYREASLKGHRRGISSVAFSPVDRVLASASNDGSVRLWSLVSLTCLKTLQADRAAVLQLGFFNGGGQIVTGNAEGVLRVWAIATSESVWSAEVHQEKVWALAVQESETETVFYTGAADGVLVATEDYTAEEVARLRDDRHAVIQQEQALANAMRKGEYSNAFLLALRLNHPRHLRQVLVKWCAKSATECEGALKTELLSSLNEEQTTRLLQFTREWLTNSRHCHVASLVTYAYASSQHFVALSQLSAMPALVEPLLAYLRKHSKRLHDLQHRTYYIDYTIRSLTPNALTVMPPFVQVTEEQPSKRVRAE